MGGTCGAPLEGSRSPWRSSRSRLRTDLTNALVPLGEIVSGGPPPDGTTLLGWGVHAGVSLAYAFLFGFLTFFFSPAPFPVRAAVSLVAALGSGWVTAMIAPPAISVTVSLLGRQGGPGELYPLNTEPGLPLWNHLLFFLLNWVIQSVGPHLLERITPGRGEIPLADV